MPALLESKTKAAPATGSRNSRILVRHVRHSCPSRLIARSRHQYSFCTSSGADREALSLWLVSLLTADGKTLQPAHITAQLPPSSQSLSVGRQDFVPRNSRCVADADKMGSFDCSAHDDRAGKATLLDELASLA